jgi:hypothetical protein
LTGSKLTPEWRAIFAELDGCPIGYEDQEASSLESGQKGKRPNDFVVGMRRKDYNSAVGRREITALL